MRIATLTTLLTSCYAYAPVTAPHPSAGARIVVDLTDPGRVALSERLAPAITSLEGTLAAVAGDTLVIDLLGYSQLRAGTTRLTGERIQLHRQHVAAIAERRFSRQRTVVAIGSGLAVLGAFIATKGFIGRGAPSDQPPPSPGGDQ